MTAWILVALLALVGIVRLSHRRPAPAPSGTIDYEPQHHWLSTEEPTMERKPKFEVYKDKRKGWRWRLLAANGRTLAQGEAHTRRRDAVRAVETVVDTAAKAGIVFAD